MRQFVRNCVLFGMMFCVAASAEAATPSDFYLNLLRRGVAAFDAEKYVEATTHLRIAAFGFVDSIEHYQTAQIYLTLAYDRQDNVDKARDAARRVVAAERVERKYATLKIPAGIANSFDAVARKLLTNTELAFISRAPQTTTPPPAAVANGAKPRPAETQPEKKPVVVVEKPAEKPPVAKPVETRPAEKPAEKPPAEKPTAEKPPVEKPPVEKAPVVAKSQTPPPAPAPAPKPQVPTPAPQTPAPSSQDIASRLAAGERALTASELSEARRVYRGLLDTPGISRETLIRIAEGLYRSRDFEGALLAFAKIGTLRHGEEPYHYYVAVAHYETGRYQQAKKELEAALPYIEITPDVARYRAKIEGALE